MLVAHSKARACCVTLACVLVSSTAVANDLWLSAAPGGRAVLEEMTFAAEPQMTVHGFDQTGIQVGAMAPGLALRPVQNDAERFLDLSWPEASKNGEIGHPAIPVVRRIFAAPPGAEVSVSVRQGAAVTLDLEAAGLPRLLMPVQAPVPKIPGARENAPFDFDPAAYQEDVGLLPERVVALELGTIRGQRLFLLEFRPVDYNPAGGTLTFYPDLEATVGFKSGRTAPQILAPLPSVQEALLNPAPSAPKSRYGGNYLIIVTTTLETDIAAFATAKTAQGFTVTTHTVADGTSNTVIKDYIESLWGTPDAPEYVLLVGDTNLIPHWTGGGAGNPATDLPYACMDGPTDWYPDISVGRFPAQTTAHLTAMVDKTLYYENGPLADPDYLKRAVFMASTDNHDITEGTHEYVITNYMDPNGYSVTRLYHYYGATTQGVADAFNAGVFYGIYSGHGGTYSWADGPPFYQSDVNALTNVNMYPYVFSFACITGTYTVDECFIETWSRAPNKGAVVAYGSSVNSYWDEDDILERRLFDVIFDEGDAVDAIVGPVYIETLVRFLAHYGPTDTTRRYFEMYNCMGDPSLKFPGTCSDAGTITLDRTEYQCESTITITVGDCGLNTDDAVVDTVTVSVASDTEPAGESVLLTETNASSAEFVGAITASQTDAAGVLWVSPGDTVTATYVDADDGAGNFNVTVTDTALVDCDPPAISNVQTIDIEPRSATVTFDADEPVRGIVHYGLSCGALDGTASGGAYTTSPAVNVSGLQDDYTYYYSVEAEDEAGNTATDDNSGACYSFTTPQVPDFFTQQFGSGFDLQNSTLVFTLSGTVDFYNGCIEPITEFPTDPTGGTAITSWTGSSDDGYAEVTLGGPTVSLYGVDYGSLYVGTNGYITFGAGDSDYSETLGEHFDTPRISAVFDDLSPQNGGGVSYKILADRVAVTYDNVPEYSSTGSNSFQIEMFFDGTIVISYLSCTVADCIVGLSEGTGQPPAFYEIDLSAMGNCGPKPPQAYGASLESPPNLPITIQLQASDDGLPDPPGALDYIITALPANGSLTDAGAGLVGIVPYTLAAGGNEVVYTPSLNYVGPDSFSFKVNDGGTPPDGGDSETATISLMIGGPSPLHQFWMDADPGWSCEGQWAFGVPTGGGSHDGDPTSGHTGANVYGYNLNGDYTNNMPEEFLTVGPLDCADATGVELRFWRWLGVEWPFDHAHVAVSNNGRDWTMVWEASGATISDSSWTEILLDISAVADDQPTVYVRWCMGTSDGSTTYPGWNIDDVELWGLLALGGLPGDMDADGDVDLNDFATFANCYYGSAITVPPPSCTPEQFDTCDLDGDGDVDLSDFSTFAVSFTG
ncbi:MAG: hypothetical protein JSU68_08080 [Phycisphaerales bacterium]|nr:MAG: hypothetical protein JSU68_08080 [Phycisphaerales bacterium]